jgi:hypothetical protein
MVCQEDILGEHPGFRGRCLHQTSPGGLRAHPSRQQDTLSLPCGAPAGRTGCLLVELRGCEPLARGHLAQRLAESVTSGGALCCGREVVAARRCSGAGSRSAVTTREAVLTARLRLHGRHPSERPVLLPADGHFATGAVGVLPDCAALADLDRLGAHDDATVEDLGDRQVAGLLRRSGDGQ